MNSKRGGYSWIGPVPKSSLTLILRALIIL
jgi:hypothetical protein